MNWKYEWIKYIQKKWCTHKILSKKKVCIKKYPIPSIAFFLWLIYLVSLMFFIKFNKYNDDIETIVKVITIKYFK